MSKHNTSQPDVPSEDVILNMQSQIDQLTEALQRERADATNIRRRHDEQITGMRSMVKVNVVRDLLPVIDNFERAFKHVPVWGNSEETNSKKPESVAKEWQKWASGVQGVAKQFEKTLSDIGVERIATVGEPFDPRYHEAVAMEEGEGVEEVVSEELQAGYKIGDEIIRHAMVRVRMQ